MLEEVPDVQVFVDARCLNQASVAELAPDVAPQGSPDRPQAFAENEETQISPALTQLKLVDFSPQSQIQRLVLYVDAKDRPEEAITRASVRMGSLDAVVVGEPCWLPATNPTLGRKE